MSAKVQNTQYEFLSALVRFCVQTKTFVFPPLMKTLSIHILSGQF